MPNSLIPPLYSDGTLNATLTTSASSAHTHNLNTANSAAHNQAMMAQYNQMLMAAQAQQMQSGLMPGVFATGKPTYKYRGKPRYTLQGIFGKGKAGAKDRISRVDRLLDECCFDAQEYLDNNHPSKEFNWMYRHITSDQAIQHFKDYNPIYAGRPKKLPMILLDAYAGRVSGYQMGRMVPTGLCFGMPHIKGVRQPGIRTSCAGVMLLEYWAEKYPKFAKFLDAYKDEKEKRFIYETCVDLSFGMEPKWLKAEKLKAARAENDYQARLWRNEQAQIEKQKAALEQERLQLEKLRYEIEYRNRLIAPGPFVGAHSHGNLGQDFLATGHGVWTDTIDGALTGGGLMSKIKGALGS